MALTFLKLGGSLITDKSSPETADLARIEQAAAEIGRAVADRDQHRLVLGHGSGSFGHVAASQHRTREGVYTPADWQGFARVSVIAANLNHIVLQALHRAGIPVMRFQPSALLVTDNGIVRKCETEPLRRALDAGLVPLVYGDVAFDRDRGGTIVSTEEVFAALAEELRPQHILLASRVAGVLSSTGDVLPQITPASLSMAADALEGAAATDVTGGMLTKVTSMLDLCEGIPGLTVRIFDGRPANHIYRSLTDPDFSAGTLIRAD